MRSDIELTGCEPAPESTFTVGLIGLYSNLSFPQVSGAKLAKAIASARGSDVDRSEHRIRDVNRRLGKEKIASLVAEYQSGVPTTALTTKYGLGKSTVLRLLDEAGVSMRRAGITPELAKLAADLYRSGRPLKSVARDLELPRTSVRAAILQLGVTLRSSGLQPTRSADTRPAQ